MKSSAYAVLLIFAICVSACTSRTVNRQQYLQDHAVCAALYKTQKAEHTPHRLENMAKCQTERMMPHLLALYPQQEKELRQLFKELETLAAATDRDGSDEKHLDGYFTERAKELKLGIRSSCHPSNWEGICVTGNVPISNSPYRPKIVAW